MRTHGMTRTLTLALLLALPAAAPALEWRADLGLDYSREERWRDGGPRETLPRLELFLGLDAGGFLHAPGTAQWLAAAQWRRLAETSGGADTTRSTLVYRLRLALFQDPRSPLAVQVHATRQDEDQKVDGTSGTTRADSTVVGADAKLVLAGLPYLNVGYQYLDRNETGPLLAGADRTVHSVTASTGHGTGTYSYSARYLGRFSDGTYDSDNYDDHRVDVDVQAAVTDDVTARLSDTYYRRIPDNRSPTNLAQELNALSTSVSTRGDARGQQQLSYSYAHALSEAAGALDLERAEQRLTWGLHRVFEGTRWQLRSLADASLSEIRRGAAVERASGQLASLLAAWRRLDGQDLDEIRFGPSFGAREPDAGDASFGWGARAGATAQRRWGDLLGSAAYDLTYEDDLYAASGWSLRQDVLTTLSSPLGGGRASGQLQASAQRRDGGLLGPGASRSLSALAAYQWRRYHVSVTGGVASGVSGALTEPIRGDGLFLPAPYDTHSSYASVAFSTTLASHLFADLRARHTAIESPDRPTQSEDELFASLTWGYAGIYLGLEDRYRVSTAGGVTIKDNLLLVRVRRGFGSHR